MNKKLAGLITIGLLGAVLLAFFLWPHQQPKVTANTPTGGSTLSVGQYKAPEVVSAEAILQDVNKERVLYGLNPLKENETIMFTAQEKCDDMAKYNYYNHVNPTTGMHGYQYMQQALPNMVKGAENLAGAQFTHNQQFVDGWMNSPEHKAAILTPEYTDTGVALCDIPFEPAGTITVVQQFAQLK